MLHKTKTLRNRRLEGLDGEMGRVRDFYFDDRHWTIRYLVANTGNWLSDRQVLISPHALVSAMIDEEHIGVDLTRQQIEESPPLASDLPVSRQFETAYHRHYGWPPYWGGMFAWGDCPFPYPGPIAAGPLSDEDREGDPHLRSTEAMTGYHIQTIDGELGHVEDFIFDDQTWAIRYLVIDTRNWWPGKKVLVLPKWIDRISWSESKLFINRPVIAIRDAPEYDDGKPITREFEEQLHQHYREEGYWITERSELAQIH
jgi:hypothetical protein